MNAAPTRAHRPRVHACAPPIDGLPVTVPVSRSVMRSVQQYCHCIFRLLAALKLLVSLISRLVACSLRIVADRQTQTKYHNPRSACALRTNREDEKPWGQSVCSWCFFYHFMEEEYEHGSLENEGRKNLKIYSAGHKEPGTCIFGHCGP